jgi:predicted alpha/beta superfamily hydrolase
MMKTVASFLLVLASTAQAVFPQEKANLPVTIKKYLAPLGETIRLYSEILHEEKEIYIGLPGGFNDSTEYPLILVLEGEILFETLAPLTRLMAEVGDIPECIVAGIPLYNRHLDYAPVIRSHPQSGNADRMLDFYRHELFPLLDSLYHCTDERIIWAHSGLGGIFCTYLLLGPDTQFSAILSSSPNLRFLQDDYIDREDAFDVLREKGELFYYLSFGGNEDEAYMGTMYHLVREFAGSLEKNAPENLNWKFQLYENNNHFTNAIETYVDGLSLYFKMSRAAGN